MRYSVNTEGIKTFLKTSMERVGFLRDFFTSKALSTLSQKSETGETTATGALFCDSVDRA